MVSEQARKLGEALVAARVLTREQLNNAVSAASKENAPSLIVGLLETGYLTFKVFEKFVAKSMGVQSAIVAAHPPVKAIVDLLGLDLIHGHLIYPFGVRNDKGVRTLALGMVDPLDADVIRVVETKTGSRVVPVLISLPDFKDAVKRHFQPVVEVDAEKENFVLVRPGGDEEEIQHVTKTSLSSSFQGTKTVQPKPGWDQAHTRAQAPTQITGAKLSVELMGSNKRKFREEILAKLDLDPIDAKFLKEETYTREMLYSHLKNVSPNKLQKIYNSLPADFKLEGLVNTLIKAGVIGKTDLLMWSAVSLAFFEEKK